MPNGRRIDHDRVRKLRAEGMGLKEIASQTAASVARESEILRAKPRMASEPLDRQRKLSVDKAEKILEFRAGGLTLETIGELSGVRGNTVGQFLRKVERAALALKAD